MHWRLLVVVAALLTPHPALAQTSARPNVVLIISDDMGWADIGSYGAPDIKTPNIDSLARDGVKFTDFYANGVLCTPTRAGLISGRYQQRYGIETALPNDGLAGSDRGLPFRGHSLPHLMRAAGYATALVGKWHLGYTADMSPGRHGFDYFFGLKSGFHDYYTHRAGDGKPDLWENDTQVAVDGYMTDLIAERAATFIDQNAGRPFFIDVAFNAPHWPYQPPDKPSVAARNGAHVMPSDPGTSTRADYVAMVERMDRGVGEILRVLNQRGLANNTIVVFTNDNGGEWLANNAPLFSRKLTVWEGGIRVPALIRWPGRLPRGKVTAQVGVTMDLTASILAAAGATVPADARPEGINLLPILEGKSPEVPRTLFWRSVNATRAQRAVRSGDWKLVVDGTHTMVFNVKTDVGERQDLTNRRQDIAQKLRPLLAEWEKDVDAEAKTNIPGPTTSQ
jgi:arylsulfatase A